MRFGLNKFQVAFILLLIFSIGLRVWPLSFPVDLIPDEENVVARALRMGRDGLNPGYFKYPPLFLYFLFGTFALRYGMERVLGLSLSPQDFAESFFAEPASFFAQARLLSALFGIALVCLIYLLARNYPMSRKTSLMAALFAAVSPLFVHLSHFSLTDGPALVPFLLSLIFSLRFFQRGRQRDAFMAGLLAGFAAAVKYPSGIAIVAAMAVIWGRRRTKEQTAMAAQMAWVMGGLLFGFLLVCPWPLADPGAFWPYMKLLTTFVKEPYIVEAAPERGYVPYLIQLLPRAMGWPLYLGGFAGLILWLRSDGWKAAVIVSPAIAYWVVMGFARNFLWRYSAPMLPALVLGAAWGLWWAVKRWQSRKILIEVAAVVLAGNALVISAVANLRLALPDSQELATEWIELHVPAGAHVLSESYGPRLAYAPRRAAQIAAEEKKRDSKSGSKFAYFASNPSSGRPVYQFFLMPLFQDRDGVSRMADDWYDPVRISGEGIEWIVLNSFVSGRYVGRNHLFPKYAEFRRWLSDCWMEAARFGPSVPQSEIFWTGLIGRGGPILSIYRKQAPFPPECTKR